MKVQLPWLLHCVYPIGITASEMFEGTYISQINGSRSVFAGWMISYPHLWVSTHQQGWKHWMGCNWPQSSLGISAGSKFPNTKNHVSYTSMSDAWHTIITEVSMVLNFSVKTCNIYTFSLLRLITELTLIWLNRFKHTPTSAEVRQKQKLIKYKIQEGRARMAERIIISIKQEEFMGYASEVPLYLFV